MKAALALSVLAVALLAPRPQDPPVVAIKGATVLTVTKGVIANGTVVIKDGKIAAVGRDVAIPEGATVIDAAGKFLMPGIIDTHSHMGVYSWPEVPANSDGNEATHPIMAHVRAEDGVNVQDPAFKRALAGGVTTIQILPGSANMVGGESFVCKLRLGGGTDRMRFEGAPRGIKMASGENPKRVYGGRGQLPSTRMGNFAVLREHFEKAREYQRTWKSHEEKKAKGEETSPPDKDLKLEMLKDVLEGKVRVHIHCYRMDEMVTLINIAKEFGFRIASYQHALEAYKVADILSKEGIGIATWADWWGFKLEAWDGIPWNAAICDKAGVNVTIHSDSSDGIQRLYTEAAKCLRYGFPEEAALASITIGPAKILGVEARVGSIEPGRDADLALFSKHPFDVTTLCEKTWIDGRLVFDRAVNKDFYGGVR
jgi:imidazolonepropionase-like amidohydrolase